MTKHVKLPKEGLVKPEDRTGSGDGLIDSQDVEGHGLPTTAPPSLSRQGPGHGGEIVNRLEDDGDDVEGHRSR